jgi:uncharacterized protein
MIYETIISSINKAGDLHIAPMGITKENDLFVIAPFKPSQTLDNLSTIKQAVINMTDDVSVIAGCLTGRRNWPVKEANTVNGHILCAALSHIEVEVSFVEEDELRPRFHCKEVYTETHAPFKGFNRAQAAVLEAAILVSRLRMLPLAKIRSEIDYLQIAIDKTAGEKEKLAWDWLMKSVEKHLDMKNGEAELKS